MCPGVLLVDLFWATCDEVVLELAQDEGEMQVGTTTAQYKSVLRRIVAALCGDLLELPTEHWIDVQVRKLHAVLSYKRLLFIFYVKI